LPVFPGDGGRVPDDIFRKIHEGSPDVGR
jgi:hypothetical protein